MMESPRRALSGIVLGLALALTPCVLAQDAAKDAAKAAAAEIKKAEDKVKEEAERVAKKKENLQVEFNALNRPETKAALQAKLTEIGNRHRAALRPAGAQGADSRAKVPDAIRNAIQEECRAAVAATVGRNLSTVLDSKLAANLIIVLRDPEPVNYQTLLDETIAEDYGSDFEANYRKLMPVFEKKLFDLKDDLAAAKQKVADLEAEITGRTTGTPPGMVLVPGGKIRIGIDAKEWEAIKKLLGFDAQGGNIDAYHIGWPAHEVEIQDFFIDINEVTCRQWSEFIRDTQRKPPKIWHDKKEAASSKPNGLAVPPGGASVPETKPSGDDYDPPPGMENLPVTMVTLDDIEMFLAWCGRRLPTEFEWEAAARAKAPGDKSARWWPWGDTYDRKNPQANNQTAVTLEFRKSRALAPVGFFPTGKSALGINDLAGNAIEITSSLFNAYPGWDEKKAPSTMIGKDPFSGSMLVLRGGSAAANEQYSLDTTRKGMSVKMAEYVGFRTAQSRVRGKDVVFAIAGENRLAASLGSIGPAFKDEKSGRPELAIDDPTRYSAIQAGGWDSAKQVPARARHIAVIGRNTLELSDAARIKSLARDQKQPLMLGYLQTDVDLKNPEAPKGSYWVMWDPGRVKQTGKEKLQLPEALILQSTTNPDNIYEIRNVNPVLVQKSTEATKFTSEKDGSVLSVLMTFPVRDRKEARFIIELRLETEPGALKEFRFR